MWAVDAYAPWTGFGLVYRQGPKRPSVARDFRTEVTPGSQHTSCFSYSPWGLCGKLLVGCCNEAICDRAGTSTTRSVPFAIRLPTPVQRGRNLLYAVSPACVRQEQPRLQVAIGNETMCVCTCVPCHTRAATARYSTPNMNPHA